MSRALLLLAIGLSGFISINNAYAAALQPQAVLLKIASDERPMEHSSGKTASEPKALATKTIISQEEAYNTLIDWHRRNSWYPVSLDCIEQKGVIYSNKGFTIPLTASTEKACSPYTSGVMLDRWRVDAITREIYLQNEKGKFVVPDLKHKPSVPVLDLNQCLEYEPKVVQLTGYLFEMTFPGPPEYYSVEEGDEKEVSWYLHLEKPVCTSNQTDSMVNGPVAPISEVQLVIMEQKQFKEWGSFLGKSVTARGTLFHGFTGHHNTDVLITVKDLTLENH